MKKALTAFGVAWLAACGSAPPNTTVGTPHVELSPEPPAARTVEIVASRTESPVISFRIVYDAGSGNDQHEGATALAARLMTDGAAGEWTYAQIQERLFPMAASVDYHVDREQTVFTARVHRDHLEDFYAILRAMLIAPQMTETDFARVLAQSVSELTQDLRGNDDEALGQETLQAMLYEGHAFGHPTLGTARSLSAMTLENVRAQRTALMCEANLHIGLAGSIPDGFGERLQADLLSVTCPAVSTLPRIAAPAAQERRVWLVDKPDAASTAVSMGIPLDVTRDDADYPALVLATAYFGQHRQFAGRLMQKMRGDRGLNYGDYAYTEHFEQDGWSRFPLPNLARHHQYFSIWLRPVLPQKAQFAIRMAVREFEDFIQHGMTEADFTRIRDFASQYYALFLQTESRRLGYTIDDHFYGMDQAWLERVRAAWQRMTVADVNAAIQRHLDASHLQIAVVTSHAAAFADALASDAPSPITYDTPPAESVLAEDRIIQAYPIHIARDHVRIVPVASIFE